MQAQPFIGERANGRFFTITCKLRRCLLFFPGIHVAKKVFVMISSTGKEFFVSIVGNFCFFTEGRRAQLMALAAMKGLNKTVNIVF